MFLLCVGGYSGAENMTLLTAHEFTRRGYDVTYCSPVGEIERYINSYYKEIKYVSLKSFKWTEIKKAINKVHPDILYAVDFKVSVAACLLGIRYIVHLHNNPHWIRKISPGTIALWYAMEHSQANICVSDSIMCEYVFASRVRNITKTLLNVVNADKVLKLANEPIDDYFDIGFIGRITEQKNPLRFIELIREICVCLEHNVHVVMIGPDGGLWKECRNRIDQYNLDIHSVGFQDNPYKFINKCKLILMPSKWEGFGLTAVESMILGVPVLASPVGGLPNVIGNKDNLCDSNEEFVHRAAALLTDEKLYNKISLSVKEQSALFTDIIKYVDNIEILFGDQDTCMKILY